MNELTLTRRVLLTGTAALFLGRTGSARAYTVLTVKAFESSAFFAKYKVKPGTPYALKTGGMNFPYSCVDVDGALSSTSVELSSDPAWVKQASIIFRGNALYDPATLTQQKKVFVRDFVTATFPDMKGDAVNDIVSRLGAQKYDGGSDRMPRTQLGEGQVFTGTTGESLIVGLTR